MSSYGHFTENAEHQRGCLIELYRPFNAKNVNEDTCVAERYDAGLRRDLQEQYSHSSELSVAPASGLSRRRDVRSQLLQER